MSDSSLPSTYEPAGSTVSESDRLAYQRDGFLIIEPGLDEATLDAAMAEVAPTYLIPNVEAADYGNANPRVIDAWVRCPTVRSIALAPKVLAILEALYGRRPRPFQTLNFPVGTEQAAHSDTIHFNSKPAGFMCGVWVAFEDIDESNGPLFYYPGSHRLPELTMNDAEERGYLRRSVQERLLMALKEHGAPIQKRKWFRSDEAIYPAYERMIADEIASRKLERRLATMKKGQAIIWAANLLHGGARQLDRTRSRHSQVTHYFFENCRTYTPLRSFDSYTHYRDPDWIT